MRPIRTVPPKDEREYPLVITAEEKDKVLNYILVVANGKRTAKLNYKDTQLYTLMYQTKYLILYYQLQGKIKPTYLRNRSVLK